MKTISLSILFLFVAPLHAQDPYRFSRIALYSGLAFDLGTTEVALRAGATEGNRLLGQNPYQRITVAIGSTVAVDFIATKWLKPHPKLARLVRYTVGAIHIGAGTWNLKQR